jgi:predicted RNA-binding Zn-ribbon protein involved in translation (DUF1610 family)
MDESKKKPLMIGIIVVCLVAAGAIFWFTRSGGGGSIDDIPDDEMTWVICLNKSCNATYQIPLKQYYKTISEATVNPMGPPPALTCKECGKAMVYKAEKCQNPACGIVFRSGSVPNDFQDRCPKCGKSATEELRNARKREMAGG